MCGIRLANLSQQIVPSRLLESGRSDFAKQLPSIERQGPSYIAIAAVSAH